MVRQEGCRDMTRTSDSGRLTASSRSRRDSSGRAGYLNGLSIVRNPVAWLRSDSVRFVIRGLKARFLDQENEFRLIRKHVRAADLVCDIGANKGSFVFWLSRWCRKGMVVAFEPQPSLANSLAGLCSRLGLDNVKVEAKAAFSRSGSSDLFVPKGQLPGASLIGKARSAGEFETIRVPTVTLDEYFHSGMRVSLLKIDVEGAELDVFKGAERILREQSPLLVFECENRHLEGTTVQDVFSYLRSLGYAGSFVCRDRLLPVSAFDASLHQKQHGGRFWKDKDYCNNFVFAKTPVAEK